MDNKQAEQLLGVTGDKSVNEINKAYATKSAALAEKITTAPTKTLKTKYTTMLNILEEARNCLLDSEATSSSSSSPLSATKLADLPSAGPQAGGDLALEVGTVLAGRYEIKAFLAQGGMGVVYRAFDGNRNEDIAIKVMLPSLMSNDTARARFLDEARLSSQLSHPNIVNVYDVQQQDDLCFLTMELLQGQDLRELMNNRSLARQHFTVEEVLEILTPICAGLEHAHDVTVHRDIKPENIFLTEDGKYKLMDFGIARVMSTSQRTQTGAASGTAYYMAPEQLKGAKDIDGRADQYALAVLAYELLSGEVPAGAIEPLNELVRGLNKKVSASVQKALSPKPDNRYATLPEFLAALQGRGSRGVTLNLQKLILPVVTVLVLLSLAALISGGALDNVLDALKPIDKAQIAQQKAGVAKLQGEIKIYKKRLDNGQRNLQSEVRDAGRNDGGDLKYLQHWQQLTDDYLFEGNAITELEGQLSMAESLLREESVERSMDAMKQVRDGYKALWDEFNAAESLLRAEEAAGAAQVTWEQRQQSYSLAIPTSAREAEQLMHEAKRLQRDGAFFKAKQSWLNANEKWQSAYSQMDTEVADIEQTRADERQRVAAERERQRVAAQNERARILAEKARKEEASHLAKTKQLNTIEAYNNYLTRYPSGKNSAGAEIRLQELSINALESFKKQEIANFQSAVKTALDSVILSDAYIGKKCWDIPASREFVALHRKAIQYGCAHFRIGGLSGVKSISCYKRDFRIYLRTNDFDVYESKPSWAMNKSDSENDTEARISDIYLVLDNYSVTIDTENLKVDGVGGHIIRSDTIEEGVKNAIKFSFDKVFNRFIYDLDPTVLGVPERIIKKYFNTDELRSTICKSIDEISL